jgi:DNA (cytosine-5)-methyltransferase 1
MVSGLSNFSGCPYYVECLDGVKMRVNDLFCGAGGMGLGFKYAGWNIVGAWDFDKYAVQSYKHNVGNHVKQTDISQMSWEELPQAECWTFGFPCQDLSNAGKQAGLYDGKRSRLFFEVMRLLDETMEHDKNRMPLVIMAENVKGLKPYLPVLEEEYQKCGYKMIYTIFNSKYWGVPQNRERYFVVGVSEEINKNFVFPIQQTDFIPKLSSVLEKHVDEKYYIDDLKAAKIIEQAKEGLRVRQATKKGFDVAVEGDSINISHPNSKTRRGRVGKQVAQTLLTGTEQVVVEAQPQIEMIGLLDMKGNETVRRVYDTEGLAPTLTTSEGGHRQPKILCVGNTNPSGNGMNGKVYDSEGLAPTVTTNKGEGHKVVTPEYRVRKLTPREYARLQGFPESYEQIVSNSQFYKQMGNAVTVNVSQAIACELKKFLEEVK